MLTVSWQTSVRWAGQEKAGQRDRRKPHIQRIDAEAETIAAMTDVETDGAPPHGTPCMQPLQVLAPTLPTTVQAHPARTPTIGVGPIHQGYQNTFCSESWSTLNLSDVLTQFTPLE